MKYPRDKNKMFIEIAQANENCNDIAQVANENHNDIAQVANESCNDITQVANENCNDIPHVIPRLTNSGPGSSEVDPVIFIVDKGAAEKRLKSASNVGLNELPAQKIEQHYGAPSGFVLKVV